MLRASFRVEQGLGLSGSWGLGLLGFRAVVCRGQGGMHIGRTLQKPKPLSDCHMLFGVV